MDRRPAGQLAGRRALITGGGRGIGKAIASRFAAEGAAVAIAGRDAEALEASAEEIRWGGSTCVAVAGDVSREEDAARIVAESAGGLGGLDVVVNNAAIGSERGGRVHEFSVEEWDQVLAIDLRGPFLISRAAIPYLLEAGGGALLQVSSASAITVFAGDCAYGVAKAGLNMLSDHIAVEYAPQGIRSNTLMPGAIRSDLLEAALEPAELDALKDRHPIGRFGELDEIAAAAVFLCAAEPGFLTGANVPIDGACSRV